MNIIEPTGLHHLLGRVGEQIASEGPLGCRPVLEAMSAAIRDVSPGVAAALVDWDGSEVARQRAFGLAHGLVVEALGPGAQRALLDTIEGRSHTNRRHRSPLTPSRRAVAVAS